MPDHAFASSVNAAADNADDTYDAIHTAIMGSERGRRFLAEYARRNDSANAALILAAVSRMETLLAAHLERQHTAAMEQMREVYGILAATRAEISRLRPDVSTHDHLINVLRQAEAHLAGMMAASTSPRAKTESEAPSETEADAIGPRARATGGARAEPEPRVADDSARIVAAEVERDLADWGLGSNDDPQPAAAAVSGDRTTTLIAAALRFAGEQLAGGKTAGTARPAAAPPPKTAAPAEAEQTMAALETHLRRALSGQAPAAAQREPTAPAEESRNADVPPEPPPADQRPTANAGTPVDAAMPDARPQPAPTAEAVVPSEPDAAETTGPTPDVEAMPPASEREAPSPTPDAAAMAQTRDAMTSVEFGPAEFLLEAGVPGRQTAEPPPGPDSSAPSSQHADERGNAAKVAAQTNDPVAANAEQPSRPGTEAATPQKAGQNPLAAIEAMSDEERIALFS